MKQIIQFLLVAMVSGCGLIDKQPATYQLGRPSPGEERHTNDWHCVTGQSQLWSCKARRQQIETASAVAAEPEDEFPPPQAPAAIEVPEPSAPEGFALQLGAYRNREIAAKFMESIEGARLELVRTTGRRGEWYLVLGGSYPDRETARAAATDLLQSNPGLDYWVRDTANLRGETDAKPESSSPPTNSGETLSNEY